MPAYHIKIGSPPRDHVLFSDNQIPFINEGFHASDHGAAIRGAVKQAIARTIHVKTNRLLRVTVTAGMTEELVFEATIPYSRYLEATP